MKQTTMLSQITTQEDVLFAGITVRQLVIWMMGGIALTAIYLLVPQPMKITPIKGLPMLFIASTTAVSSIKFKGQLLLDRWIIRIQYLLRPTIMTE